MAGLGSGRTDSSAGRLGLPTTIELPGGGVPEGAVAAGVPRRPAVAVPARRRHAARSPRPQELSEALARLADVIPCSSTGCSARRSVSAGTGSMRGTQAWRPSACRRSGEGTRRALRRVVRVRARPRRAGRAPVARLHPRPVARARGVGGGVAIGLDGTRQQRPGLAGAIDLASGRVRDADWLLSGVRQGQDLGDLLGAEFERRCTTPARRRHPADPPGSRRRQRPR